jgi:hypothetical protein
LKYDREEAHRAEGDRSAISFLPTSQQSEHTGTGGKQWLPELDLVLVRLVHGRVVVRDLIYRGGGYSSMPDPCPPLNTALLRPQLVGGDVPPVLFPFLFFYF